MLVKLALNAAAASCIAVSLAISAAAAPPTAEEVVSATDRVRNPDKPFRLAVTLTEYVGGAERDHDDGPLRFRQYVEPQPGEQVVLVDDILRTGNRLSQLQQLLQSRGAEVVGLAVVIYQPNPHMHDFGSRRWPPRGGPRPAAGCGEESSPRRSSPVVF